MTFRNITFALIACSLTATAATNIPSLSLKEGETAVKIELDGEGLYEIDYEKLKELGFSDPAKVGVAGYGGEMMPMNFTDPSGSPLLQATPPPVAVRHAGNKLYFYATGTKRFSLEYDGNSPMGAAFRKKEDNLYSRNSVYILSDAGWALKEMPDKSATDVSGQSPRLDSGIGYVCHDIDLSQNCTMSGNIFWGESFTLGNPSRQSWDVTAPGAMQAPGVLECVFYADNSINGKVMFGIEGDATEGTLNIIKSSSANVTTRRAFATNCLLKGDKGKVFVDFRSDDTQIDYANLDYWLLSYPMNTESLFSFSDSNTQNRIGFHLEPSKEYRIDYDGKSLVLDVTDPRNPVVVASGDAADGKTFCSVKSDGETALYLTANLSRKQMAPISYSPISSPRLRERWANGAELLIITNKDLSDAAKELASLHGSYDGINVAIAEIEEIYDEFSSCMPSPMAYRCAARILYDNTDRPLRNVLILAPLSGDIRGITSQEPREGTAIALQDDEIHAVKGAMNSNDFAGFMDDYVNPAQLNTANMQVGLGILPVNNEKEAFAMVEKIKKYLDYTNHSYTLNEFLSVGGVGDSHTHDKQAIKLTELIETLSGGNSICSTLAIDAYGKERGRTKMIDYINSGKNLGIYIGHGSSVMLGKECFFSSGDIFKLRNTTLPFMIFAACDITNFDRGQRGLGEELVVSTPYGLIGSLLSTRSSWSGQNMDMVTSFFTNLYSANLSPQPGVAPTIGEVYAVTKTKSTYKNELAYHLMCDPALRLPTAYSEISVTQAPPTVSAGNELALSGNVMTPTGDLDSGFSGHVAVKVTSPSYQEVSADYETNDGKDPNKRITVTYADDVVAVGSGEVSDGRLEAKVYLPTQMEKWNGQEVKVYLCAYDENRKISSAGSFTSRLTAPDKEIPKDRRPPVIESMDYDVMTNILTVTASDDTAIGNSSGSLNPGFELRVDGRLLPLSNAAPRFSEGSSRAVREIALPDLAEGTHSALVKIADIYGNTAMGEVSFSTGESAYGSFTLHMAEKAVEDSMEFLIHGTARNPELRIIDSMGKEIFSARFDGDSCQWDRKDKNGQTVSPGLYRAYIAETGQATDKSQSRLIYVPVI